MEIALGVARAILAGFDRHYRLFREVSAGARLRFERGDHAASARANRERIEMYDRRVGETVERVLLEFPEARAIEQLWPDIKRVYIGLLYDHKQPECAETFYNSVACRVLSRGYYHNEYIFWRPAVSTEFLDGERPIYSSYYPGQRGLRRELSRILDGFQLDCPWEDRPRDLRRLLAAVRRRFPGPHEPSVDFQIHVLSSLFFRGQSAYAIGRAISGSQEVPFALAIRRTPEGKLVLDALLTSAGHLAALFSLARLYFMVDMEVPSAYVTFLSSLMPAKTRAELYTAVGLQKQGKTLFYRDLHAHFAHSTDRFVVAPGQRGMVMVVFTLPSFPFVFKMIRDRFEPPKDTSPEHVRDRYRMVKLHDRAGRMADTLEYSDVALPVDRFDPALLEEMQALVPSRVERDPDDPRRVLLKHVYIERRLTPLDVYLRGADEARQRAAIAEYGRALREIARANIFAGDLLLKNFGITRWGRVVFYDYDEICYLDEVRFRDLPPPRDEEDELRGEPWFSVGPRDVFPEELWRFVFGPGRTLALFEELHGDLARAETWQRMQDEVRSGAPFNPIPYPDEVRLR